MYESSVIGLVNTLIYLFLISQGSEKEIILLVQKYKDSSNKTNASDGERNIEREMRSIFG
jgi:hypothetical protein